MSLLEDVRTFTRSLEERGECPICGAYCPDDGPSEHHDDDCQMLTLMPRIVAALEAAEAVLWAADSEAGLKLSSVFPRQFVSALEDLEIALDDGE